MTWSQILSAEEIEHIHHTSMQILEHVGVSFPDDEAIAVFKKQGVKTDGHLVYLKERQVMNAIKRVPQQFTILARNPERSVTVGAGEPVFAPAYGAPFLVDYKTGKRSPTLDDYHSLVKLAHALPNQDMSGHLLVEPEGVPAPHLAMLHAHILHSDKPFIGSTVGKMGAQHTLEMARILFGADVVKENFVTIGLINSLTPLGYSNEMLVALMEFARNRQPVIIAALAMAGSTSPITLAGTLAVQTAELLAGIVLTQFVSPGTPAVFGSTSTNIDMRSGALAIGSPELSQMIAAHAQIARYYGLPSRSGGALTDASTPDAQAGFESMLSLVTTISSGIDFVLHAGGILSSYLAFSYEKLTLDDEMCGMVRRYRQGIAVNPETLSYDVIAQIGVGGNFLMETQTLKRCRSEFWQPHLCDRGGLEAWMQGGRETALDRAHRRWQKLVAEHQDPVLDETTARQLDAFVTAHTWS
ncbi:MAG TPA: trimethylamine--corrinoid methyltransferase [Chloroflexi bacterium]|nr:trimethylamine--corrinoid methyltransferase [Chloroflexota bacterium]